MNNELLRKKLSGKTPGLFAHRLMSAGRMIKLSSSLIQKSRKSAVLLLIANNSICLTKRSDSLSFHGGQICFPGGKKEDGEILLDTALRETYEEIGLTNSISILGRLSPVYVKASNATVTPFVGSVHGQPSLTPNPQEVQRVFWIPIKHLLRNKTRKNILIGSNNIDVPGFSVSNEFIWGATAMILSEFLQLYKTID